MVEVVTYFLLIFTFLQIDPWFDNADQKNDECYQPKAYHDVGRDRVVHVILVMLAITDFIEHGHDYID